MADYERRIYYIYDYSKGHKEGNKGYIIHEKKNNKWKQQIFLKDKYDSCNSDKLTFAWYVWEDEKILALDYCCSKCSSKNNSIEHSISPGDIQGIEIDELSGLIIKDKDGYTYAAAFDERNYEPDFVTYVDTLKKPEKVEFTKPVENIVKPQNEDVSKDQNATTEIGEIDGNEQTLEIQEVPEFLKVTKRKAPERVKYEKSHYMRVNDWKDLFKKYDEVEPFDDDIFCQCVEIAKEDLKFLPPSCGNVANNSFLLHGLFNYRHLLLGQCKCKRRKKLYVLGVPGRYINSERKLAAMYGFYNFKAARRLGTRTENFGYWYIMFSE